MTEPDKLLEQISQNTKDALRYSRLRFIATWIVVGLVAILTCAALVTGSRNAQTDLDQTDEIAMLASDTADSAKAQSEDTVAYLRGEQGIPGVPGESGQDGTPGLPSAEPGPEGEVGPKGEPGTPGTTGAFGPVGPAGIAGLPGDTGSAGATGENGLTGAQGESGEQGPKGERGDAGARGEQGAVGPTGAQGPPGVVGPLNTSVAIAQTANDTTTHKVATATCSAGTVTGGGYAIVPSDPGLIPTASSPAGNGWSATVDQLSLPPGTNWQVLVFAVCVS